MLPRSQRLRGKRDVQRVYQRGERHSGRFLLVRRLPNRIGRPRVAVVVAKAVSNKATERNRAKRILRAILTQSTLPPDDLVVSVRRLPPGSDWHRAFKEDLSRWFSLP